MVRTAAGRSRGCGVCRQRRIKCDETFPHCKQCKRSQRQCPGPITDTFYVIASAKSKQPASSTKVMEDMNQTDSSIYRQFSHNLYLCDADITSVGQNTFPTFDSTVASIVNTGALTKPSRNTYTLKLPSYYQPSRVAAFEELFFSHFFSSYGPGIETIGVCSWLSKLPALMTSTFSGLTMKYSFRASCMAFYGLLTRDISIQTGSRRAYVKALQARRAELNQDTSEQRGKGIVGSEEAICATVMMCYFEMTFRTMPSAWMLHLDAAAAILVELGPEGCQEGFMHQLFRTVRLGIAFESIALRKRHTFAQEQWKMVPFQGPKLQVDQILDVLFSISEYIFATDAMVNNTTIFGSREQPQKFQGRFSVLISRLDKTEEIRTFIWENNSISSMTFNPTPFTSCLAALKHAAYLICFSFLASTDTTSTSNQVQAFQHSEAALAAIDCIDISSQSPTSGLYMTTVFALSIVTAWSPSTVHQAYALKKLENNFESKN